MEDIDQVVGVGHAYMETIKIISKLHTNSTQLNQHLQHFFLCLLLGK